MGAGQGLDLQFPAQSVTLAADTFRINQPYRMAGSGVSAAFPFVVRLDTAFQVVGDPGIKRPVFAAEDIAVIRGQFFIFFRKKPPKKVCPTVSAALIWMGAGSPLAAALVFR